MEITLKDLKKILKKVWCRKTSVYEWEWRRKNPAYGQCIPTALIVQDFFGGTVLFAKFDNDSSDVSHFWNRLPNKKEVDLTYSQLSQKDKNEIGPGRLITRDAVFKLFKSQNAFRQYILLRSLVDKQLLKKKNIEKSGQGDR